MRNMSREAKLQILDEKWTFILSNLQKRNAQINPKDKYMDALIMKLFNVKRNIRRCVLEEYLRCC